MSNGNHPVPSYPVDRMVPHSVESEEATLGALLIDSYALYDVMAFLKPEDFFIVRNGWVYEALLRLHGRGDQIDYITVLEELRHQSRLEEVGGAAYITYLINHTPPSIYIEAYAHVVERAAIRRRMLAAASEIAQLAHEESSDIHQVLERGEQAWLKVSEMTVSDDPISIDQLAADDLDRVQFLIENPGELQGIPSGFKDIDDILGGFQPGDMDIIAGRPGSGKTSLALSMALNISERFPVLFFSMEMNRQQITQRLKSALSGISTHKIRAGRLDPIAEWPLYLEATKKLSERRLFVDDRSGLTPLQIMTKARRLVNREGVRLIAIDYAQLIKPGVKRDSREQEVAYVSSAIKGMAKDLNVPVLLLAQLNRATESRADKRPTIADLRESGSLENDADVVMLIYRDEMYNEDTEKPNQAEIIIGKHRNGPTGTPVLYFRKELTQFSNLFKNDIDLGGFSS